MATKLGTFQVVFTTEKVMVNPERDLPAMVAAGGPQIPARFFEGAWTAFVRQREFEGDNGVVFSDAVGPEARPDIQTRWPAMNRTAFPVHTVWGEFQLEIEIYDWRQVVPVRAFLEMLDAGFVRIGAGRNRGYGRCEVVKIEWLDETGQVQSELPRPAIEIRTPRYRRPYFRCENGHVQPAKVRENGGVCKRCQTQVQPQWYAEKLANRPWQGELRVWGDKTPMLDPVEVILNRDLGLELPSNPKRAYQPAGTAMPAFDVWHVDNRTLKQFGLPKLPWELEDCIQWRSRLDVFVGLAIIFKAQGASDVVAATAAAVIHRLLTGFILKPENAGEWSSLVDEVDAENIFRATWYSIQGAGNPTFQQIAEWVIRDASLGLTHTPSAECQNLEGGQENG